MAHLLGNWHRVASQMFDALVSFEQWMQRSHSYRHVCFGQSIYWPIQIASFHKTLVWACVTKSIQ